MAYRESIQNEELRDNLSGSQFFYNIHENVGYGYRNNKSDVMLVQYFLNQNNIADGHPERRIVEDGKFGGKTWRAIKDFQNDTSYLVNSVFDYVPLFADGCVTSTNGTRFVSKRRKVPYTILILNIGYQNYAGQAYFQDITIDSDAPEFLREQLTGMPQVA